MPVSPIKLNIELQLQITGNDISLRSSKHRRPCTPYAARSTEGQVRDRDKIILLHEKWTLSPPPPSPSLLSRCNVRAWRAYAVIDIALISQTTDRYRIIYPETNGRDAIAKKEQRRSLSNIQTTIIRPVVPSCRNVDNKTLTQS